MHAERGDLLARVLVADGRRDARAGHHAELDGGHADAAGRAVDEQPLADGQAGLGEERVVGGGEDLGDAARGGPVELVGDRHRGALVHDRVLGLAAAGDDRHHAVARLEAADAAAARDDLAGELEARDVGGRARRRGVVAGDLQHVGAVETGGADADEQLPVLGLGIWVLGDLDPAVADRGGAHAAARGLLPGPRSTRSSVVAIRTIGYKVDVGVPIPQFPPLWRESRAGVEAAALFRSSVWRGGGVPDGEGRPVLLIPGFLAGDGSLATMTRWLRENGYHTRRAGIRANVGCSEEACQRLETRLERFAEATGQRVAIIGQSRGGVFARALAVRRPDLVSGIVDARRADRPPVERAPVRARPGAADRHARHRPRARACSACAACAAAAAPTSTPTSSRPFPPEVGYTALYSRTDGVVHWRACLDPAAEQIEVRASHVGMAVNAEVYAEVGHALGGFADGQIWAQAA